MHGETVKFGYVLFISEQWPGYTLYYQRIGIRFQQGAKILHSPPATRSALVPTLPSAQLTTEGSFPGSKAAGSCSFRAGPGWNSVPSWSCSKAVYKPVRHIPLQSVQRINYWLWTDELSETCRVSCQNKFVKLVHLVGLIIRKFVTMHGHTNIKF
jgi:hypothetical protein